MTLEKEYANVATRFAKDVYSRYVVDAYELRSCPATYDKNTLERLKLRLSFTSNGVECHNLKDYGKHIEEGLCNNPMLPIPDESESLSTCADCVYVHVQSTAAEQWTVVHNLGYFPNVTIVLVNDNGTETEIQGLVTYSVDKNSLLIDFSEPLSGKAYLS